MLSYTHSCLQALIDCSHALQQTIPSAETTYSQLNLREHSPSSTDTELSSSLSSTLIAAQSSSDGDSSSASTGSEESKTKEQVPTRGGNAEKTGVVERLHRSIDTHIGTNIPSLRESDWLLAIHGPTEDECRRAGKDMVPLFDWAQESRSRVNSFLEHRAVSAMSRESADHMLADPYYHWKPMLKKDDINADDRKEGEVLAENGGNETSEDSALDLIFGIEGGLPGGILSVD